MRRKLSSRVRGKLNSAILTPAVVRVLDWVRPAKSLGARGEREAERYLLKRGLIIIHRGYSNLFGEIDLIAVDDRTIVFVEVKTRVSDVAGNPLEAVDELKQEKIARTAVSFLKSHDLLECRVRFDVISILWPDFAQTARIDHIEHAFETPDSISGRSVV